MPIYKTRVTAVSGDDYITTVQADTPANAMRAAVVDAKAAIDGFVKKGNVTIISERDEAEYFGKIEAQVIQAMHLFWAESMVSEPWRPGHERLKQFFRADALDCEKLSADVILAIKVLAEADRAQQDKDEGEADASGSDLIPCSTNPLSSSIMFTGLMPCDFYENSAKYETEMQRHIETSKSLVYSIDDDGEKLAAKDKAFFLKVANANDGFSNQIFNEKTAVIASWREHNKAASNVLRENVKRNIKRFDEHKEKKLENVRQAVLDGYIALHRESSDRAIAGLENERRLDPLIKLSGTLTPGGKLTKQAIALIHSIIESDSAWLSEIERRKMTLENESLKARLVVPVSPETFGGDFYNKDIDIFNHRLDVVVKAEVKRAAEAEASRIDREIARVKAEAEKDRLDAEKQKSAELKKYQSSPAAMRQRAADIDECAARAGTRKDREREQADAASLRAAADRIEKSQAASVDEEKRIVTFVIKFSCKVRTSIQDSEIEKKIKDSLPPPLLAMLKEVTVC